MEKTAITPTREQDFPEWYQQVIKAAEMAENSVVRGCMVIRPWGYGLWECMQRNLDRRIKATGHENAYFPLFIPLSFLEKEASHVAGFAKECAVVTHHRLEERNGKLIPTGELEEPLIVRPTSETIIGDSFAKWVQSYRDLPLLINQWANVVRWEMRTRLFLRTAEFLWQEGHTVHASRDDAMREVAVALEMYRDFVENDLAVPVIAGEKISSERFPGAEVTQCIEAMMGDRKALQAGTSHYLGQNFSKAAGIKFLNQAGETEFGYTTSWGVSTRLIGAIIMSHADDNGLRIPPKVAPKHLVILPVIPKPEHESSVFAYADKIADGLRGVSFNGDPVVTTIDRRDLRGGEKSWQWIKRGIPLRVEIGPRDIEAGKVTLYRRDQGVKERHEIAVADLAGKIPEILGEIQANYFSQASAHLKQNTQRDLKTWEELISFFTPKNSSKPEIHGGFALVKWSDDPAAVAKLAEHKISVRVLPFDQSGSEGRCIVTGKSATLDAILAKAY